MLTVYSTYKAISWSYPAIEDYVLKESLSRENVEVNLENGRAKVYNDQFTPIFLVLLSFQSTIILKKTVR